ncbi:mediator of RNA polymerase II transcription subunit 15a-like [Rosa sericea]
MDNNNGSPPPSQSGEPSMEAGDWRSKLPADMRQRLIKNIMSTLKPHRPISGQEGLDELEKNAVSLEEKFYAAATSQLDYLLKISQEMLTVVTKPQNTTSNSLESNGKGLLDSVADQGQSVSMSLPANQSQTRQQFVSQNIQNNILPAGVQSFAGLSSALPPTMNYQTREQFVPQNIQNSILPAGAQSSVGLSSALSPTGLYHLYCLQPPAPGQNIPGLSSALPPPQGLNISSALLASTPSGFSSAPASTMQPSTLQSSLPRLQQNQQSTIPHSTQSMLQQTAVLQQKMLPQQHQQQQLTGSSTAQQNKMNPSQLITTIKNSQQQVPMGSIQQTPVSAPQQANMNVQRGINTLHPNVIPLGILQYQQHYQNQLQQQYQLQLLHQQRQQLQLMQMQQINQQLQQQLSRQSQTHQMPQLDQIRVVDANMNASSSQSGSNMLQGNIVSPPPNSGIVDNQHLKQEEEQKMFKNQLQQPYQQLQMQKPQMLQEKQQQKIQQLEQQAKQQLCHIYIIYLIFLTILMGALFFGTGY